jgi:hypothetical protein
MAMLNNQMVIHSNIRCCVSLFFASENSGTKNTTEDRPAMLGKPINLI